MQPIGPMPQTCQRRQKPRCRSRVPYKNLQRLIGSACIWDFAIRTFDLDCPVAGLLAIRLDVQLESKPAERLNHDLCILTPKRPLQSRLAVRQRRQNQRPVGDAFRAWHRDFGTHRLLERDDFDEVWKSHSRFTLATRKPRALASDRAATWPPPGTAPAVVVRLCGSVAGSAANRG